MYNTIIQRYIHVLHYYTEINTCIALLYRDTYMYNIIIHTCITLLYYTDVHTCITLLYRDTYMYNTIIQRYTHV